MSDKKAELQEYFNALAAKPFINQMQMKALIERGREANERNKIIRELVTKDDKSKVIEGVLDLDENHVLVIKSTEFKHTRSFSVDVINLETKEFRPNWKYYDTKEEAIIAGMITKLGGNDTIMSAVMLMLKGCK